MYIFERVNRVVLIKVESVKEKVTCFHCGEDCKEEIIQNNDLVFCCTGCKTVYEILKENNLCEFYSYHPAPGESQKKRKKEDYSYLNNSEISKHLITYNDEKQTHITFYIPSIHCSSCIWLLENLHKLNKSIIRSRVNFIKKEVSLIFKNTLSAADVAEILAKIGYAPKINMDMLGNNKKQHSYFDKKYFYKLGITFFCFGNIMLLSFPEYFGVTQNTQHDYKKLFSYLNFILALPIIFYSAQEFFVSALNGVKSKVLNMDFPIALGILIMFIQSSIEIFTGSGAGYMDTLASLVFLMLIGRALQNITYGKISFDRDYKSYFPVAVTRIDNQIEKQIPVTQVKIGDRLLIRNQEIIPADCILFRGDAAIDYSFVTGEAMPVNKTVGEIIYAGGKQTGQAIEVEIIRGVSQSHLTKLWNDDSFSSKKDERDKLISLSNKISKYFTVIVLIIAAAAALYWLKTDVQKALRAFTSVLIITCPCALALSTPFALGNAMRIFGLKNFYLKNTVVIEKLAKINTIIFDKTGTITNASSAAVSFHGIDLTADEEYKIMAVTKNSNHPASKMIYSSLLNKHPKMKRPETEVYKEISGKGIIAVVEGDKIKIGNAKWFRIASNENVNQTRVYIQINEVIKGYFVLQNQYREGIKNMISNLKKDYAIGLLSGDNDAEKSNLKEFFNEKDMNFSQSPFDKLNYIKKLQKDKRNVLMLGDGLNDAGALMQSNVGIAVSDDVNNFSPACDAVIAANALNDLPLFLRLSKSSVNIIIASFVLSFLYNLVGLWFAVQGMLSPLIAAILMPISSITIILFTTIAVNYKAYSIFSNAGKN